jgi:hypothetical protein
VRTLKTLLAAIAACLRIFVVGYFRALALYGSAADAVDLPSPSQAVLSSRLILFRYAVNK